MSQIFFEKVFVTRPWKALFVTQDDDISEWWLRWKVDRYTYVLTTDMQSPIETDLEISY